VIEEHAHGVVRLLPLVLRRRLVQAWQRTRAPFYRGSRYLCPCCGGHFRKFLDAGSKQRANALCPRCGSRERHRMLWLFLSRETPLVAKVDAAAAPKLRVLHFAPEPQFQARLAAQPHLDYVSADLNSPFAMQHADITQIPYPDASFDAVLCNHVLEHVPDDGKALRELFRVLRSGGFAVLQHPIAQSLAQTYEDPNITEPAARARAFGQTDHVRVYGRDFGDRVHAAGFSVEWIDYAAALGPAACELHALKERQRICYCTKPAQAGVPCQTAARVEHNS